MARYTGPKTKIARKFGEAIFGDDKTFEKRNYPPGQHGNNRRRGKKSEYSVQLMEKQKAKYTYGILERQFRNMFEKATRADGITGEVLLQLCENRLDNVVYRMGISPSRSGARQLVSHRHITVNGEVLNIPSFHLQPGDVVGVREKSKSLSTILDSLSNASAVYEWITWNSETKLGTFVSIPARVQNPDKVIMIDSTDFEGKFEFRPLEPGYGLTVGNALRRVLLSSLEGFAITSIRIEGVDHEFSTIPGVVEDVTEIILNLKQVRFKRQIDEIDNEAVTISVSGQEQLTAGHFQKFISGFQILNPDLVICNLDKKVSFNMELTVEKGRGYVPAEENKKPNAPLGTIFTDSVYTPIKNVKYSIENFRVEQKTDYEKLVFEIVSDGSIHPKDALTEAAKTLIHHFMLFSDERITLEADEIAQTETYDEESLHMRQLLKTKLVDMDLSVRALNCLKAAEVDSLGDLVSFNKNDLMKFRNFGKKSLTELEELVINKGLSFGMDLSKYKLDKD